MVMRFTFFFEGTPKAYLSFIEERKIKYKSVTIIATSHKSTEAMANFNSTHYVNSSHDVVNTTPSRWRPHAQLIKNPSY